MTIKENLFQKEDKFLSPYATKSKNTKGRLKSEEPCAMRTEFQRDRDRIMYSKSFVRLKNKTQVFFSPEGDHYMTRLTHTLDVMQVARSIARSLDLNEDLAEAISLGHDLGHTPFGHAGERVLDKLTKKGFKHNEQSLRVVDVIENDLQGLNLTIEVRDGILNHKMSGNPMTLEGQAVSLADRIAYLNHDVEDAIRAGIITENDIPKNVKSVLGNSTKDRINTLINSVYVASYQKEKISLTGEVNTAIGELRDFMFDNVYLTKKAMIEEEKAFKMLSALFNYFINDVSKLPDVYKKLLDSYDKETVVCDYISGMTDRYATNVFKQIFIPENF
ncbi:MAG: deoxyguanosinetriphosphate triphosphohydrolase [Clostridia bacterium]|nr:deoxyguanosinetriphosphate triphosphohydrolase [Clostridia bacterium]